MGAILDLWKSERGLVAVALIAAATTLTALGTIGVEQWLDYTKWIFVTYAAAKTVTGSVAMATSQPKSDPGIWQQVDALIARALANSRAPAPTPPASPVSVVPPTKAG